MKMAIKNLISLRLKNNLKRYFVLLLVSIQMASLRIRMEHYFALSRLNITPSMDLFPILTEVSMTSGLGTYLGLLMKVLIHLLISLSMLVLCQTYRLVSSVKGFVSRWANSDSDQGSGNQ